MATKLDKLVYRIVSLGWVGGLGVALIGAAVLLDGLLLRPMTAERDALAERNALAASAKPATQADTGPAGRLPAAPLAETAEATLRRLFASARRAGLSLDQGDYQLSHGKDGSQTRYQFTLPVHGSYPAIRGFVARMLNDDPALAVASLEMSRAAIEDAELDATLHFVLYLKGAR